MGTVCMLCAAKTGRDVVAQHFGEIVIGIRPILMGAVQNFVQHCLLSPSPSIYARKED